MEDDSSSSVEEQPFLHTFVDIVAKHPAILQKGALPHERQAKKCALDAVSSGLRVFDASYDEKKILKTLNNLKRRIKEKMDPKTTGNRSKKLKSHEERLLSLLNGAGSFANPSITPVSCAWFLFWSEYKQPLLDGSESGFCAPSTSQAKVLVEGSRFDSSSVVPSISATDITSKTLISKQPGTKVNY